MVSPGSIASSPEEAIQARRTRGRTFERFPQLGNVLGVEDLAVSARLIVRVIADHVHQEPARFVRPPEHVGRNPGAHEQLRIYGKILGVMVHSVKDEADLRIATGLVEPHFMAGWSGGRKEIAPGVAQQLQAESPNELLTVGRHRRQSGVDV